MADANLNNFETTLRASLSNVAASLVLSNADANRLHTDAFAASKTARLTLRSGSTREVVVVSARTVDTPSAGLATVTITTRAAEKVSATTPAAQAFPNGSSVYAATTAAQIEAIRAAGGGGGGSAATVHALAGPTEALVLTGDDWIEMFQSSTPSTLALHIPDDPDNVGEGLVAAYRVQVVVPGGAPGEQITISFVHDTTMGFTEGDDAPIVVSTFTSITFITLSILVPVAGSGGEAIAYVILVDQHAVTI